jgi:colanic acid biosynthesis glycosyl transferase WcaI
MRILVHDFAGHPSPIQLSRELAGRGHAVTHTFPSGLPGPKGRLDRSDQDLEHFRIQPVPLSTTFLKYSPWKRFASQRTYARDLRSLIDREMPDVVLSGNTPIDIQAELLWHCHTGNIAFVHWVQDVYCEAMNFFLRKKIGRLSNIVAFPFQKLEKAIARGSEANIVIASAFGTLLEKWGVDPSNINVLENWGPLEEIVPLPKDNEWSVAQGLGGKTVFLYSGTMGFKHRADLLYDLAERIGDKGVVVVVTEGVGRDYLAGLPPRDNLLLLGFQPYEELSQVLAAADVLLATLESDACTFAVPSKVLTYLCAGRPILLSAPESNLASAVVKRSRAGFVADPAAPHEWTEAATVLASDPALRERLGRNARLYAESNFDISNIGISFEKILAGVCRPRVASAAPLRKAAGV